MLGGRERSESRIGGFMRAVGWDGSVRSVDDRREV